MNRRQALKNIGLGAGVMVVGPSTLSLLQSCKNEPDYEWEPVYLNAANGFALKKVLDVILPASDTPGASDLNIAQFIDSYMNEVAPEKQRNDFTDAANAFTGAFKDEFDKDSGDGTDEEYEEIVSKYLKASDEEREEFMKRNTETQDPQDSDAELDISNDAGALSFLESVRSLGVWAWKNSEEVGEEVLWYDPIPGEYIPCGPVEELGGGKAMSL